MVLEVRLSEPRIYKYQVKWLGTSSICKIYLCKLAFLGAKRVLKKDDSSKHVMMISRNDSSTDTWWHPSKSSSQHLKGRTPFLYPQPAVIFSTYSRNCVLKPSYIWNTYKGWINERTTRHTREIFVYWQWTLQWRHIWTSTASWSLASILIKIWWYEKSFSKRQLMIHNKCRWEWAYCSFEVQ